MRKKKIRVLLLHPRATPGDSSTVPYSCLTVAAPLVAAGFAVEILDEFSTADYPRKLEQAAGRADIAGISCFTGHQIPSALRSARLLRAAAPGVPIVWGGYHPSLYPAATLESPLADFVITGQGEWIFLELVQRFARGEDIAGTPGLWRLADGKAVQNLGGPGFRELDQFPAYPFHLVDLRAFLIDSLTPRSISYHSSLGCPFRCNFCAVTQIYNRRWSGFPPDRVLHDIKFLLRETGARSVEFYDNNFFVNDARSRAIAKRLLDARLDILWSAEARPDKMAGYDDDMLALLAKSGLKWVFIGAESGHNAVLELMERDHTEADILEAAENLHRYDIQVTFSFNLGYPGEPADNFARTEKLCRELRRINPDTEIMVYITTAYDGTPAFHRAGLAAKKTDSLPDWAHLDQRSGHRKAWLPAAYSRKLHHFSLTTFYATSFLHRRYKGRHRYNVFLRLLHVFAHLHMRLKLYRSILDLRILNRLFGLTANWRIRPNVEMWSGRSCPDRSGSHNPRRGRRWAARGSGALRKLWQNIRRRESLWLFALLWRHAAPVRLRLLAALAAGLLFAAANAGFYALLKPAIERAVQPGTSLNAVLVLMLLFYLLKGGLYLLSEYWAISAIQDLIVRLRQRFLQEYLRHFKQAALTAEEAGKFFEDINQMCGAVKLVSAALVKDFLTAAGLIVVLFLLLPKLAAAALVIYAAAAVPMLILGRKMQAQARTQRQANTGALAKTLELLENRPALQSLQSGDFAARRLLPYLLRDARQQKRVSLIDRATPPVLEWLGAAGFAAVLLLWGSSLFTQLAIGGAVAFAAASVALYSPLKNMGAFHIGMQRALASARRLRPFFEPLPETRVFPPLRSRFRLEIESCTPDGHTRVLHTISLGARAGECIGVTGPNGAGKSTLLRCLAGLQPFRGALIADGQPIRPQAYHSWPPWILFAGDKPALFNVSVYENICLGRNVPADRIEHIAAALGLLPRLAQAGLSFTTPIGEAGERLSHGMQQRLVCARMIAHAPQVLLLDEVFSPLEPGETLEIFAALQRYLPGCIFVIATHEPALLARMDRVVLLRQGRLAGWAPHTALLARSAEYRRLFSESQRGNPNENLPHRLQHNAPL